MIILPRTSGACWANRSIWAASKFSQRSWWTSFNLARATHIGRSRVASGSKCENSATTRHGQVTGIVSTVGLDHVQDFLSNCFRNGLFRLRNEVVGIWHGTAVKIGYPGRPGCPGRCECIYSRDSAISAVGGRMTGRTKSWRNPYFHRRRRLHWVIVDS